MPEMKKTSVNPFIDFQPKDVSRPSQGGAPPDPVAASTANPFIQFHPKDKFILARQGDGPPSPSPAADTMHPNSRPGDPPPMKKKVLKEEDQDEAVRRYLLKRRMYWFYRIDEETTLNDFVGQLEDFAEYVATYLDLQSKPPITLIPTEEGSSFACWTPEGIDLAVTDRHPMDVFRSLAHELVHHKQHEEDVLHAESGVTGSDHENEANALAGILMRNYASDNPQLFGQEHISEAKRRSKKISLVRLVGGLVKAPFKVAGGIAKLAFKGAKLAGSAIAKANANRVANKSSGPGSDQIFNKADRRNSGVRPPPLPGSRPPPLPSSRPSVMATPRDPSKPSFSNIIPSIKPKGGSSGPIFQKKTFGGVASPTSTPVNKPRIKGPRAAVSNIKELAQAIKEVWIRGDLNV